MPGQILSKSWTSSSSRMSSGCHKFSPPPVAATISVAYRRLPPITTFVPQASSMPQTPPFPRPPPPWIPLRPRAPTSPTHAHALTTSRGLRFVLPGLVVRSGSATGVPSPTSISDDVADPRALTSPGAPSTTLTSLGAPSPTSSFDCRHTPWYAPTLRLHLSPSPQFLQ